MRLLDEPSAARLLQRLQIGHDGFRIGAVHTEPWHRRIGSSAVARDSLSQQTDAFFFRISWKSRQRGSFHGPLYPRIRRRFHRNRRSVEVFTTEQLPILVSGGVTFDTHGDLFDDISTAFH